MSLFSPLPILPNLTTTANTVTGPVVTGDTAIDLGLGLSQPTAPVLEVGVTLGGSGPALAIDVQLLDAVTDALPVSAELTSPLGSVSLQDGLSIVVDLDTSMALTVPTVDLGLALGGTDPLAAVDAQILVPDVTAPAASLPLQDILGSILPDISLDVGLDLGAGGAPEPAPVDSSPSTPIEPPAPVTDSGPDVTPTPDVPSLPSLPSVDVEIDLGLGGGTDNVPPPSTSVDPAPVDPVDVGTPPAPSTGGSPSDTIGANLPPAPVGAEGNSGTGGSVGWIGGSGDIDLSGSVGSVGAGATDGAGGFGTAMSFTQSVDWAGRDWIEGNAGNNTLMGLSGNDTIFGHGGDDVLYGNQNDDRLYGGLGNDTLHGGRDNDFLSGDEGDDQLWGDYGDDVLEGGDGADMFCFDIHSGNDIIMDFNAAQGDRLNFQGQEYAIHDMAGTAVITLSGGGAVMLSGVSVANLDAYIVG